MENAQVDVNNFPHKTGQSTKSDTGFISLGSSVQVRSPLLSVCTGEESAAYHDSDGVSATQLATLLQNPQAYYRRHVLKTTPPAQSQALARGSLVHTCLEIGRDQCAERIVVAPEEHCTSTGLSTKKATREWLADLDPKAIVVSPQDAEYLGNMWEAVEDNLAVARIIENVEHHEVSIRWERDGHLLKARPDAVLRSGQVVDWKTTRHASPKKMFWRSVCDYFYHMSHEHYLEGATLAGFSDAPLVYVCITTGSQDVEVQALTIPKELRVIGKALHDKALAELSVRKALNQWKPDGYGEVSDMYVPKSVYQGGAE